MSNPRLERTIVIAGVLLTIVATWYILAVLIRR